LGLPLSKDYMHVLLLDCHKISVLMKASHFSDDSKNNKFVLQGLLWAGCYMWLLNDTPEYVCILIHACPCINKYVLITTLNSTQVWPTKTQQKLLTVNRGNWIFIRIFQWLNIGPALVYFRVKWKYPNNPFYQIFSRIELKLISHSSPWDFIHKCLILDFYRNLCMWLVLLELSWSNQVYSELRHVCCQQDFNISLSRSKRCMLNWSLSNCLDFNGCILCYNQKSLALRKVY